MPFPSSNWVPLTPNACAGVSVVYGVARPRPGVPNVADVVYVGQASDFHRRILEHTNDPTHPMWSHGPTLVFYEIAVTQGERDRRERELIAEFQPPANQQLRRPPGRWDP